MKFKPHSAELFFRIVQSPTLELIFKLFINFVELKSKKLLFVLDKGKLLDLIEYFFPHELNVDFEFKLSAIFKSDVNFHVIFIVYVSVQFLYFGKGK